MICVFVALYFLVLFFIDFNRKNKVNYLFLLRFTLFSILGGLISGVWWFTAFIHLSGTKGTIALPPFRNDTITVLLSGFMENSYSDVSLITRNNRYMSMFIGVVPLVFVITYFFNARYTLKERIIFFGLCLIYAVVSTNSVLSAIFHGGREPTWFPTRFSFIMGFIVCFLSIKGLSALKEFNPLYYIAPAIIGGIALLLVTVIHHNSLVDGYPISIISVILYYGTIIVAVGYSLLNHYSLEKKCFNVMKKCSVALVIPLIAIEVVSIYRGSDNIIKVNMKEDEYVPYSLHLEDVNYMKDFDLLKTYEASHDNSPFYRMEATFNRPGNYNKIDNNPMFYNYAGLSNFSSSSKKEVENYMSKVGFHYNGFFSKYDGGSTYAINSLFGIKYLLEDKSSNENIHPYFLDHNTYDKLELNGNPNIDYYYNPHATSLAFQSDKSESEFIVSQEVINEDYIYTYNKFEYQNAMFKTLDKSNEKDIFYPLDITNIDTTIEFIEDIKGIRTYQNVKKGDSITVTFIVPVEARKYPLYFSEKYLTRGINYFLDGNYYHVNTYWNNGVYSFKDTATHRHTLRIIFNDEFDAIKLSPELYYENTDISKEYLKSAKKNEFVIDSLSNSAHRYSFNGHINVDTSLNKDLVFTIPNEKEVHVKVDGKKVESYTRYDIFTAIDLSNIGVGTHEISIYYQDDAFMGGMIMSIIGLLTLVPVVLFYNRVEKRFFAKEDTTN